MMGQIDGGPNRKRTVQTGTKEQSTSTRTASGYSTSNKMENRHDTFVQFYSTVQYQLDIIQAKRGMVTYSYGHGTG